MVDVLTIGYQNSTSKLKISCKIVDDESIREVIVDRGNIVNIPVSGRAHITISLPSKTFIGTKKDEVEFISNSNIVIDARDKNKSDILHVKNWVENLEPFSF
jgi:hypothetical protein